MASDDYFGILGNYEEGLAGGPLRIMPDLPQVLSVIDNQKVLRPAISDSGYKLPTMYTPLQVDEPPPVPKPGGKSNTEMYLLAGGAVLLVALLAGHHKGR
jgi:hypothetical protein